MNVLHINSNYLHSTLYSEMISKLEELDISNDVVMPRKKNDYNQMNENLIKNNAYIFESRILTKFDRILFFRKQNKIKNWLLRENINFNSYDLIHAHTLFSDGYQAYISKQPYVVTVRNTDINYYMKYYKHLKFIGRRILKKAAAVIFLSEAYKTRAIENLFEDKQDRENILLKSHTIPNGVNDFWIKNSSDKNKNINEKINILFIGRIMENKNIEFLAENLQSKYFNQNIEIYIVGDIVEHKYYKKIQHYKNLTFLGKKNKEEIIEIMKKMHIFALISHHETFGLVYLEAITQNLPVLYTKNEGFDQFFFEGKVGYSVSPKNGLQLIKKVNSIIKNYDEIQTNLNEIKKEKFGWNFNALCHKNIYLNAFNQKRFNK